MSQPWRWPALAGLSALLLTGSLAVVAAGVSRRPPQQPSASDSSAPAQSPVTKAPSGPVRTIAAAARRQERIEAALRPLLCRTGLRAGVFGYDLGSGAFFTLSGDDRFAAASLIKIPIAVALLAAVDRGEVALDETLEMRACDVAGGSGRIQYLPLGSRFSIERLGELMIRKSDNTATNMLIARLGGIAQVNDTFVSWGLDRTRIQALLPDMEGTNGTSPQDLVSILHRALDERLLGPASRARLLSWMSRSHVRSMIPASVSRGAFVANKTGDIPGALGDAGYVLAPGGSRYLLAVQVERPRNSPRAKELIRRVSSVVWEAVTGTASPLWHEGRGGSGSIGRGERRSYARTRAEAS